MANDEPRACKLISRRPTYEMIQAAIKQAERTGASDFGAIWQAMFDAAESDWGAVAQDT